MTPLVQWLLVGLGLAGALGTWVRALVALREHRAMERQRVVVRRLRKLDGKVL